MIAYKGFLPGLICRGYQFRMGLNVTEKANCAHNGFHCAEDPLDCLRYYGDINHAEYYIVDAGGDIDEDGVDSKISCTELTILKRLTKKELFLHGLAFMADHPKRKWNSNIKEGRMLHHCVGNDGAGERYYDRIERRESFIMFLRRAEEPEDPYYTLEIEPDGTVRQKRTLFDRQHEDIEQATEFLQKWQKVIAARLTGQDLKLAAQSRVLRNEEFIQMKKDRVVIHTGHLAGHLLADVLLADLMENKEVVQQQELPAAA